MLVLPVSPPQTVEEAQNLLNSVGADSVGCQIMAPKTIFIIFRLKQIPIREAIILKQEMLSLGGEVALSREVMTLETSYTDALLMGTLAQCQALIRKLKRQQFSLPELGAQIERALQHLEHSRQSHVFSFGPHRLELGHETHLMGIINTSPDSFSGDGIANTEAAVQMGLKQVKDGAVLIDVGGESTRPGSQPISPTEEIKRTVPVVAKLAPGAGVPVSIDTYKPEVAKEALHAGASLVNDISGLSWGAEMARLCADFHVPLVIMHIKGTPADMQKSPHYEDVVGEILAYFQVQVNLALNEGLPEDQIILDPGIGFGKTTAHNLEILRRLREFKSFGFPLLIGPSRKSFIGKVLGLPMDQRLEGTAASVTFVAANGADIIRVHDVAAMSRVVRMTDAITRGYGEAS